jgi:hypothetical protein
MAEQPVRAPFRPRVWWSPAQGVIEQVEPRWPGEEMRVVRTRDRRVVQVPDDAVELVASPEPSGDVVETVAEALRKAGFADPDDDTMPVFYSGVVDYWESRIEHWTPVTEVARAAIAAMPPQGVTQEQIEQAALFLFAVRTYSHRRPDYARKCWEVVIDDDGREAWRRTARDLLAFAGVPVQAESSMADYGADGV